MEFLDKVTHFLVSLKTRDYLYVLLAVVSGTLFGIYFIPHIVKEFHIPEFLKHPLVAVIVLVSLSFVARYIDEKCSEWNLEPVADALLAVAVIGLILEIPHIREFYENPIRDEIRTDLNNEIKHFDTRLTANESNIASSLAGFEQLLKGRAQARYFTLSGHWNYVVMDEHNNIIHSGYANVKQEGHHVHAAGNRMCQRNKKGKMVEIPNGGLIWYTKVATITEEGDGLSQSLWYIFHFENVPKGLEDGLVEVRLPNEQGKEITSMTGHYTHLPPYNIKGQVRFEKHDSVSSDEEGKTQYRPCSSF